MKRIIALQFLLFAGLAALAAGGRQDRARPEPRVVVLHTNDLHGAAYPWRGRGGLAALAATIKRVRKEEREKGARVFVVDCGDLFQGTPEGDLTEGRLFVDAFNEIGYDALCVGNHEFDRGPGPVEALARRAKFPFLAANLYGQREGRILPYLRERLSFPDARIEFVGLISSDLPTLVTRESTRGLQVLAEAAILDRLLPKATYRTVVLSHVGHEREMELAAKYPVAAWIGGHSHRRIQRRVGSTFYSQAGSQGRLVGVVEIGEKTRGRFVSVSPKDGEDPAVKAIVARYAPEIDKVMNERIGELLEDCPRQGRGSSPLGNWLCDVMREATGAEIAFHNRTGIRAALSKGPVRLRDVYQVSPFRNTLVVMKLKGRQIRTLLARAMTRAKLFLEVSGMEFSVRGGEPADLRVGGSPLVLDREYIVVTNSFLAGGGDGHEVFAKGRERKDTLLDLLEVHKAALRKSSPVRLSFRERIHRSQ